MIIKLIVSKMYRHFIGYFKIAERNLLHNYVNRSLPEPKLNLK